MRTVSLKRTLMIWLGLQVAGCENCGRDIVSMADPDPEVSTVTVSPASGIPADGFSTATITVVLKDKHGRSVPQRAVTIHASGEGNTLSQDAPQTDEHGVAFCRRP